jgi:hypothetical protein
MKYFKHITVAGEDEKIQALRAQHGLAAYGAYWLVLEKITAQFRSESLSTSLTLSVRKWAQHVEMKPSWIRKVLMSGHSLNLWSVSVCGELITVNAPNLLKYCDEYTKKVRRVSGQTLEPVRSDPGLPALPALPDKQDLKTGACGIVDNSPKNAGATAADGGVLEAPPPPAPTGGNTNLPTEIKNLNLRDDVAKKIAALFLEYQAHPIHNNALADALLAAGLTSGEVVRTAQAFLGSVGKGL